VTDVAQATKVHHPVFARIYQRVSAAGEKKGAATHRVELLTGLTGRVIEVGAGHGLNFRHYPSTVDEVVAVEPESILRAGAVEAAGDSPVAVRVLEGVADALPCEAEEFDAGVASLVLCSVPDQPAALRDLFRVIKPGGELRFYEHVVAAKPRAARLQRMLDRTVWPLLAGGCHAARDTTAAIEQAGFVIERSRRFLFRPAVVAAPTSPHVLGVARRP
jgi:ubiquinone/menaquinone biosynthesis C-methylase UbiE